MLTGRWIVTGVSAMVMWGGTAAAGPRPRPKPKPGPKKTCARLLVEELEPRHAPSVTYGDDVAASIHVQAPNGQGLAGAVVRVQDPRNENAVYVGASGKTDGQGNLALAFVNPNDAQGTQESIDYQYVTTWETQTTVDPETGEVTTTEVPVTTLQPVTVETPVFDVTTDYYVSITVPGYQPAVQDISVDTGATPFRLTGTFTLSPAISTEPTQVALRLGAGQDVYVTSTDAQVSGQVLVFDAKTNEQVGTIQNPYPAFAGGVRVAKGDVNGDGYVDIVTVAGPGGGPHVKVFSGKDGSLLQNFMAFDPAFHGGLNVAVGDTNHDGFADVVVAADAGGGPHVKVFSGKDGSTLQSFFAYGPEFSGGVRVAVGDTDGDGYADIITGAGAGGGRT